MLPGLRCFRAHRRIPVSLGLALALIPTLLVARIAGAQSFATSTLDFGGVASVSLGTSLEFGPDGRLYVVQLDGTIDILTIVRNGVNDYVVVEGEELTFVKDAPNHNDDGTADAATSREATGITVVGTATNPVIYATSSDARVGGPSGDKNLDTNSGVITRIAWIGSDLDDPSGFWEPVDIVRGLPRSEENHATNGLEFATIAGNDYLIVCSGGHTNAGSPSTNFAWLNEYALSAAVLAVDLGQIEAMPILNDGVRDYVYDLPTVDDPTRANVNGITDPDDPTYDGIDVNDPFGGNDGLNQARIVAGGPVQIFSGGYRNTYDLVLTEAGAVFVTDNGANGGWGGYPMNEGLLGDTTNEYRVGEPGSNGADPVFGDPQVNNQDHLTLITNDVQSYVFGSFYGGHPAPIRANPVGAGLFTRGAHSSDPTDANGNTYTDDWFRTVPYDPDGAGDAADPMRALPADWPPVPPALANPVEGDFRNPGGPNPDGPVDALVTTWPNNTNGIDEYTASNFGGAMQGNLIAGRSGGFLQRAQLNPDGSLASLQTSWVSNLGGNPLGITANGPADPFVGTIWVSTFDSEIIVLEPQDFFECILPGEAGYDPNADTDADGYTNDDEDQNGTDPCNGASQPGDFDKNAGAPLTSDLIDPDDDADGIDDAMDVLQLGDPTDAGPDGFALPVVNELFSDNPALGGYLGLGMTGLMNNGDPNPNWLLWIDEPGVGPNPNDVLGGAVGAMTMQMTEGTAFEGANSQEKGFQYGAQVDLTTEGFKVQGRLLNLGAGLQLYPFAGPAELGISMGDGTQSNYIAFVVTHDGVEAFQEIDDVAQPPISASIAPVDRPLASIEFELVVDVSSGVVEAFYGKDGGPLESIGTIVAQGTILDGIQQANAPLVVGLIGSSNTVGAEVEGTWDYLNVIGAKPSVEQALPDVEESVGAVPSADIDLDAYFGDDEGDANLVYTIESETNPSIGTSITGNILTISYPLFPGSSTITVRATDSDGYWVEQSFTVLLSDPIAIYRVNAGGGALPAIDGGLVWSADTSSNNSPYLAIAGTNSTAGFGMTGYDPSVDTTTTNVALFDTERYDGSASAPDMTWSFPIVDPGFYELRIYMGNGWSGSNDPGERVFSVRVEGTLHPELTDVDLSATFGHRIGGAFSRIVEVTDGSLDIEFLHGAANNPLVNGIEVISGFGSSGPTPILVDPIPDQTNIEGDTVNLPVIASGGDTPSSYVFDAQGLPPGVQIEPTTGLLFGTIDPGASASSPYSASVTVDDMDADPADTVTELFTWNVGPVPGPTWIDKAEDESYTARHECSFVQAGDRFYLFGGRESPQTLDTYDFASDAWTTSASAPIPFNHFQATEYQGLIWVIGAFENNSYPSEDPADAIYVYDPANDVWMQGPDIPVGRRRGSAGLVVHDDRFYVVGGNTIGHNGGYVDWFDEFDPATGVWTSLTSAPHARDHFHAAVVGDELFVLGGRLSGGDGGVFAPLVPEVDVYDFQTATWSTLANPLPEPRAASSVAYYDGKIMVIGGEGNGQAYDRVDALDPAAGTWELLEPLNHPRHGTQAIVSGGGVYVTAGSPTQGGNNQKNMEVYDQDLPAGAPNVAGMLDAPTDAMVDLGSPQTVSLDHVAGTQGIYVTDVGLSGPDAADFAILTDVTEPFLLPVAGTRAIDVEFTGSVDGATASLDVTHSGGQVTSITLVPEPGLVALVGPGVLALAALGRRARRAPTIIRPSGPPRP